ncbi:hypothetical protein M514_17732 [Trichuris suis]|uniref:Reverse transcriptase domain-containing protein n=1 Tax=Trichuris suis TaxID=68888 RepID=A0A085NKY4_9BILA|nr:hypothetical protein M514_17732 [Trichuris suis]
MGSPLSPVLAEVFMEHLEEKAFTSISTSDAPIFFKRYVDDIFAITTVGKEETFLEHLNSLYPTKIKLTMEKEVDNKLPFLDVLVIKQVRSDKITVPFDGRPGVVYNIRCGCNASYIGETGNTLLDRYKRHMSNVGRYKEAVRRLKEPQTPARTSTKRRGRPQREQPQKIMAETIKASAVVEHSSQCSHDLQPSIICRESRLHLRRVKEALFIRNNRTINRDKGVETMQPNATILLKREFYAKKTIHGCVV